MKRKLNWENLMRDKCPRCGNNLFLHDSNYYHCAGFNCIFKISPEKKISVAQTKSFVKDLVIVKR